MGKRETFPASTQEVGVRTQNGSHVGDSKLGDYTAGSITENMAKTGFVIMLKHGDMI
jgi:hypothetical protein